MKITKLELSKQQLLVLFFAWFCYVMVFFERLVIPPVLPLLAKELSLSATQSGSYMTAFFIGYFVSNLPGGLITDRFGYKKTMLGTLFATGLTTGLMGIATNYEMGFIIRVFSGLVAGAATSSVLRAVFEWFPSKGRGMAIGLLGTGTSAGLMVANLFIPAMARDYGWQKAFIAAGILNLVPLILIWLFLKARSDEDNVVVVEKPKRNFMEDVKILAKNKNLLILGVAGFFAQAATWGAATWANAYMNKVLHISLVEAGAFMSMYALASVVVKPFSGILADVFAEKRRYLLSTMLICMAPAMIGFGYNTNLGLLYILAPLLGFASFMFSPVMNLVIGDIVPVHLSGSATGFVNTIWQAGSIFSPFAVGLVLDMTKYNYFYAFVLLGACGFISGMTVLFMDFSEKKA